MIKDDLAQADGKRPETMKMIGDLLNNKTVKAQTDFSKKEKPSLEKNKIFAFLRVKNKDLTKRIKLHAFNINGTGNGL